MATDARRIPAAERFVKKPDCLLGTGATKVVYKGYDKEEGIEVAWNEIQLLRLDSDTIKKLETEILLLRQLRHPSLIRSLASWLTPDNNTLIIITELMTSGTLHDYILDHHCHLKPSAMIAWACQILSGLAYLHSRTPKVIHRDLKCDNLFINGQTGIVKIGDLGISRQLNETDIKRKGGLTVIGTPEFMAPECYDGKYDEKCDIWSFGLCVTEMATGETPYSECQNGFKVYEKVRTGILPRVYEKLRDLAENGIDTPGATAEEKEDVKKGYGELFNIANACLKFDPEMRPSAAELLRWPVFASFLEESPQYRVVTEVPKVANNATNTTNTTTTTTVAIPSSLPTSVSISQKEGTTNRITNESPRGSVSNTSGQGINGNFQNVIQRQSTRVTPVVSRSQSAGAISEEIRMPLDGQYGDVSVSKKKLVPQTDSVNSKKLLDAPLTTTCDLSSSSVIKVSAESQAKIPIEDSNSMNPIEMAIKGVQEENEERHDKETSKANQSKTKCNENKSQTSEEMERGGETCVFDVIPEETNESDNVREMGDIKDSKRNIINRKEQNILNGREHGSLHSECDLDGRNVMMHHETPATGRTAQNIKENNEKEEENENNSYERSLDIITNSNSKSLAPEGRHKNNSSFNDKRCKTADPQKGKPSVEGRTRIERGISDINSGGNDNDNDDDKPMSDMTNPVRGSKFKSIISPLLTSKRGVITDFMSKKTKSAKFKVVNDGTSFSTVAEDTGIETDAQLEQGDESNTAGIIFNDSFKMSIENENVSYSVLTENDEDAYNRSTVGGNNNNNNNNNNINNNGITALSNSTANTANSGDTSSAIISDIPPNVVMLEGILEDIDEENSVITVRIDLHLDNGTLTTIHFPFDVGQDNAHDLAVEMINEFEGTLSIDPSLVEQTITAVVNNAIDNGEGVGVEEGIEVGGEEENGEEEGKRENHDDGK